MTPGEYCQEIERYLCRKNDGHLIRIVGPSFERVTVWAERGVPLKVAFAGIDRYFARYYATGPRRRPVRIDFCEADVLDLFDEWRRAVGVLGGPSGPPEESGPASSAPAAVLESAARRGARSSLPAHVTRVMIRLTEVRVGSSLPARLASAIDEALQELGVAQAARTGYRGAGRAALLGRLEALDDTLASAAGASLPAADLAALERQAAADLHPFRARMPAAAYRQAVEASLRRLVRERFGLPTLRFEA